MALIGCIYLIAMLLLNVFSDFSYELSIMPYSRIVSYTAQGVALLLCLLSFFLYTHHSIYFIALETLTISYLYTGRIYTALFLTAILFVLLLLENRLASRLRLGIYLALEVVKLALVIPYGVRSFFEYLGISLFALARNLGWCEDWSCRLVQSGRDLVDVVQTNHGEDEATG